MERSLRHRRDAEAVVGINLEEVGKRITQLRLEHGGMTMEELASKVGVSSRAVGGWEAGDSGPYRFLPKLEKVFKTPSTWILYGDSPPRRGESETILNIVMEMQEVLQEVLEEIRSLKPVHGDGVPKPSRRR